MRPYIFTYLFPFVLIASVAFQGCPTSDTSTLAIDSLIVNPGDIIICGGDEFGEVLFDFSGSAKTRDTFNLGLSLLHSFEHEEAEKAFAKVLEVDKNCAMAYWGLAMCKIDHPKWGPTPKAFEQGTQILQLAKGIPKTARESEYLQAVGAYYHGKYDQFSHNERSKRMELKMEEIYERYPGDKEAAILYSLALFTTADPKDKSYASRIKAGKILESLFSDQPNHPGIAHYIIHNYDSPELAHLALSSARRYADIAPGSAHAQHMPSHIFTRLGLWDESIESNLNSKASAICYAEEVGMKGHWGNEIHAMDYLVYAYLQKGDNEKAREEGRYLQSIFSSTGSSPYNFVAIPARIALENKDWEKAAMLQMHASTFVWKEYPWEQSLIHFTRALGAAHTKDMVAAEQELRNLQGLQQELKDNNDSYKADQVMIQVEASKAWIELARGHDIEALRLMKSAVDIEEHTEKHPVTPGELLPARELLGDMYMALENPTEAIKVYELNLKEHPNRFNGIYGAALASKIAGDQEKAKTYFGRLLALAEGISSDRPELQEARDYLATKDI